MDAVMQHMQQKSWYCSNQIAFKEKEKIPKHGEAVSKREMDFLPIAFETYGRIGETACKFVKNLINQLVARMTKGGRDVGLQNKSYYIWCSLYCVLYKKEILEY